MDHPLFSLVYDYIHRGTCGVSEQITVEKIRAFKDESKSVERLSHNINALIQELLNVRSDGDDIKFNKISLIKKLFEENVINYETIENNTLTHFLGHKDLLINFIFSENYIPIERFLSFKIGKSNILNFVFDINYDDPKDTYYYFKFFCEKGVKLVDCNLERLSMSLIEGCHLDVIKYILNNLNHIALSKDIIFKISTYLINFNVHTHQSPKWPKKGETRGSRQNLKIPAILDIIFKHRHRKNIKKLYEIKELIEISLDHGYDTSLKDAQGRDLIDYLYKYQYDDFIPDRLRPIIDNRYPIVLSDVPSTELEFETKISDIIDSHSLLLFDRPIMTREKLLNIIKEFKPHKYNKNSEKINESIPRLKDIADLLSKEKGLKNAVADGLSHYFHGLYGFLYIEELYTYWGMRES